MVGSTEDYQLQGVLFSKVIKQKVSEGSSQRFRERVSLILPELTPIGLSKGCTSSKISVPIPAQPALRMRMGFQGPTLQIIVYLHTYDTWKDYPSYYDECKLRNYYTAWKWDVTIEDLLKVSSSSDIGTTDDADTNVSAYDANPSSHSYGSPFVCDLDNTLQLSDATSYSTLLQIKPGTYWWVRKKEIFREAGWCDKFRMELSLERSWQWSTSGRQRPAFDVDVMECFKDGETGYRKLVTEYAGD